MLDFYLSNDFKGEGISEGIERGVLVNYNGNCIVQEGLGLGAPAIKTKNGTYFSTKSKVITISDREFIKEFDINSELIWEIFSFSSKKFDNSRLLTVFINKLTDFYKRVPTIQEKLLKLGIFSRDFFHTKSKIKHTTSLGKVSFYYTILANEILVDVDFSDILKNQKFQSIKICILNELGGDFFDYSISNNKILPPPSGWRKMKANKETKLYSDQLKIIFYLKILNEKNDYDVDCIYGRERISNFCWAGFDIEIDVRTLKSRKEGKGYCKLTYLCQFQSR